jgi:hypothetical protein
LERISATDKLINVKGVSVIYVGGAGKLVFQHFSLAANYSNILHSKNGSEERRVILIQMAGGLHPELMYSSKTPWEFILISTFEQKTTYSAIFKLKSEQKPPIFCDFWPTGGLFTSFTLLHHHPLPGHSPHQ